MDKKDTIEVNVEEIMKDIRKKIQMEEDANVLPPFESIPIRSGGVPENTSCDGMDGALFLHSLDYINSNYEVPYYNFLGSNSIKVFVKRVIRKLIKCVVFPILFNQNQLNAHIVRCLNQLRYFVEGSQKKEAVLQEQLGQLRIKNAEISAKLGALQAEFQTQLSEQQRQLQSAIQQIQDLQTKLVKLENLPTDNDEFYHDFEERFRGSQDEIRARLQFYVPILKKYISNWEGGRFVDIGCGRGEWLDILRENGATDYVGVDINAKQSAICENRGHHVVQMECIQYLSSLPDASVDLVSGFQIIEHLCMSDLMNLFQQCLRVLRPGGVIFFETPNPQNLIVGADTFYLDPSHKRHLDSRLISFIAEWSGYEQVQCIGANPYPNNSNIAVAPDSTEEEKACIAKLNDISSLLYGPQDYAVLGIKSK